MLAETARQLHAPHLPNNSAGCHLSPVLHDDQSSPVLAAHKFTSADNVPCKREREGGKERERKQDNNNATYPQGNRNSFWQSDTNWILKPQRASNKI